MSQLAKYLPLRIAAFADGSRGGNPAGAVVAAGLPEPARMRAIAPPFGDGWRVRYFSPVAEVPFCGHATIASVAALVSLHGEGRYVLS